MNVVDDRTARDRLTAIVASVLELDLAEVDADAHFCDDLGAGSLERVEIAARVERDFGIGLDTEEAASMQRLSDALAVLRAKGAIA